MRVIITAGPTHESIDPVRFIGNRSSGRLGSALIHAAVARGHDVTAIIGPAPLITDPAARRIDVETAAQMQAAVLEEFPRHQLLIMAAAVADFRPKLVSINKMARSGGLVIECEPTEDILAAAGRGKRIDQRTIGFSLEERGNSVRSHEKLVRKQLDLIVYNPTDTMSSESIESILIWPDGREETLSLRSKNDFSKHLIERAIELFG